jgi:hypothetical protein
MKCSGCRHGACPALASACSLDSRDDVFPSKLRISTLNNLKLCALGQRAAKGGEIDSGRAWNGVSSCTIEPPSGELFCRSARLCPNNVTDGADAKPVVRVLSETTHPLIAIGIRHLDGRRAGAKPVERSAVDDTGQRPGQASALVVVAIIFAVFVGRRNES